MAADQKGIVLDANILIRAVLGIQVRSIIERHRHQAAFYTPSVCIDDAREYIPGIKRKKHSDPTAALRILDKLQRMVRLVESDLYVGREPDARERIQSRDPDDWPVLATALALDLPIWIEDRDFFGCGIPTWISSTVEIYFVA